MIDTEQPTGHAAVAAVETMPAKEPGTMGFWQVWGARPQDLRPGDVLLCKIGDTGEVATDYIAERFIAKSAARVGFINQDGKRLTIGALAPVVIVRWGTHATLSESVR